MSPGELYVVPSGPVTVTAPVTASVVATSPVALSWLKM